MAFSGACALTGAGQWRHTAHTQENLLYGSEDWNCTISIASPRLASKRYIINFYVGGIVTSKGSVLPRGGEGHLNTHTHKHTHKLTHML